MAKRGNKIPYKLFQVTLKGGAIELSREHDAYAWVGKESHRKYKFHSHLREAVKKFFECSAG